MRDRAARDQRRLDLGQVGSAKDLENLQHELASLARRQADLEDIELEIMERLETAQSTVARLDAELAGVDTELVALETRRDEAYAAIDEEAAGIAGQRATVATDLPADLAALYERLRAQHGGVGAAALRQRRCGGCRLELNSVELGRIRAAPADEVLRCDECQRILVRVPDSGL